MVINKILQIALIVTVIALAVLYFIHRSTVLDLETELSDLKEEKKEQLKAVRDSAFVAIDILVIDSRKSIDSLLLINQTVKYVPYIKYKYRNIEYDSAFSIIKKTKYEQ